MCEQLSELDGKQLIVIANAAQPQVHARNQKKKCRRTQQFYICNPVNIYLYRRFSFFIHEFMHVVNTIFYRSVSRQSPVVNSLMAELAENTMIESSTNKRKSLAKAP